MKIILFLCGLAVPMFGGITLSSTALSFSSRAQGEPPYVQNIVLTGADSNLAATCTDGKPTLCDAIRWVFDSTTSPTTLHVYFYGAITFPYTPGTYSGSLNVTSRGGCSGSCTVAVSLTVHPLTPTIFKSLSGSFVGCSNVDKYYAGDLESCIIPDERPGGSFNPPSSPCQSYTDPNFGGTVKRLTVTDIRNVTADSMQKGWVGNMIETGTMAGHGYLTDATTCSDVWVDPPNRSLSSDPQDPNGKTYYTLEPTSVAKHVLGTPPSITTTTIYTFNGPGTLTDLTNGGDGDVTKDGYWCFFTEGGTATQLILLNVNTGAHIDFDYSTIQFMSTTPRLCTLAKGFSSVSHKLYMVVGNFLNVHGQGSTGPNEILSWKVGDTKLTDEGPQPLAPLAADRGFYTGPTNTLAACAGGQCSFSAHMETVEVNGRQFFVYAGGPSETNPELDPPYYTYYIYYLFMDFDAGVPNMRVDAESGGGAYYFGPLNENDVHVSCARRAPVCVIESDGDPIPPALTISNIVSGRSSIVLTTTNTDPSVMTGSPLLIYGVTGCTNANARFAGNNVTVSGTSITINNVTCEAPYRGGGSLTNDTSPPLYPHRQELMLVDATNILSKQFTMTRLAKHRSVAYNGDTPTTYYYGGSHPNINDQGTLVAFESTFGFPGSTDVYTVNTGFSQIPTADSVTPTGGSGMNQTFTFQYSGVSGFGDISTVYALINNGLSGVGACLVYYIPATNGLYLLNDGGTAALGPIKPGSSGVLSNSQCTLNGTGSTVSGTGLKMSLNLSVSFNSTFIGSQTLYGYAVDSNGQVSGWKVLGSWAPKLALVQVPTADSVSPNSGTGGSQTFVFKYSSANGYKYISVVYALFNGGLIVPGGCIPIYVPSSNGLYLLNDSGTSLLGPITPGSSTLSNTQCTITTSGTSASGTGNQLTLSLGLTFGANFRGNQTIFAYASDNGGQVSSWQTLGNWTSGSPVPTPPTADAVNPNQGVGFTQAFTFTYSSANGYKYLNAVYGLFNTTEDAAGACSPVYFPATNALYLQNDAGTANLGPITPGSSATLSNSQCTLSAAGSSVTGSGNQLSLTVSLTFTTSVHGLQTTYGYAVDNGGLNSGWQLLGFWAGQRR